MAIYAYPSDIRSEKYKHRHIEISVKRAGSSSSSDAAYKKESAKKITTADGQERKPKYGKTVDLIVLPLPNAFADSQSHAFAQHDGVERMIASAAIDLVSGLGKTGSLAAKVLNSNIIAAGQSAAGMRQSIIDPGFFQHYTGSDPREFQMEFDLIPRNAEEAKTIVMIIMKLKQYSSPTEILMGTSVLSPHFFSVMVSNKYVKAMTKMDRVIIKNISIDYGADGFMQQTHDGIPKHIKMSLTFAEVDMSLSTDYVNYPV